MLGVDAARDALGGRHLVPVLAAHVVHEEAVPDEGLAREVEPVRLVGRGEEAQAMAELVQEYGQQVDAARALVAVEAVVPRTGGQATRGADERVELRDDVIIDRVEVGPGEPVRLRAGVPRRRERGVREVGVEHVRTRRAEHTGADTARQRIERRLDADRDRALQHGIPDLAGLDERVQPLLADRGARVAADRCGRGRIVEALARAIEVDDDEGRTCGGGGAAECDEQRGEPRARVHFCSFAAAARTMASASAAEWTQVCCSEPSVAVLTTV